MGGELFFVTATMCAPNLAIRAMRDFCGEAVLLEFQSGRVACVSVRMRAIPILKFMCAEICDGGLSRQP